MDRRPISLRGATVGGRGRFLPFRCLPSPQGRNASSRWSPSGRRACRACSQAPIGVAQSITALSGGRLQVKVFPRRPDGRCHGIVRWPSPPASPISTTLQKSRGRAKSATFAYFLQRPVRIYPPTKSTHGSITVAVRRLWDELSAGFGLKAVPVRQYRSPDGAAGSPRS